MGATSQVLRGDLIDISTTGCALSLTSELERGKELHLEFELPAGRVECVGEVRWVVRREKTNEYEIGIRFVRISTESMNVITVATRPRSIGGWWSAQFVALGR